MAVGKEAGDHLTQVLFHYKGTVYPSSPDFPSTFTSSEEAKKFVREMKAHAKRMIHQGEVKEGLDKKSQVSLYRSIGSYRKYSKRMGSEQALPKILMFLQMSFRQ